MMSEKTADASTRSAERFHVIFLPKTSTRGFVKMKAMIPGIIYPRVPRQVGSLPR